MSCVAGYSLCTGMDMSCCSSVLYDIAGCDLCNQNIEKCTALMLAVRNHHTSTVRLLMQNGADLNTTDCKRVTPLYCEL